mmetsp:Transcript_15601/g.29499  ORF Transcript_15601/g.29499 Transcript_15601/m.29499 type:complete len:353 (-) Transcript_15601:56-1114(-)
MLLSRVQIRTVDRFSLPPFIMSSCPVCLENNASAPVMLSCGHGSCQSCLYRWFTAEESTGQRAPTCPVETCRNEVSTDLSHYVLGRSFVPAGHGSRSWSSSSSSSHATTTNTSSQATTAVADGTGFTSKSVEMAATEAWLEKNTISCGGCQGRIMKSEGCDKLQCICGYRVCWKCRAPKANCGCNPGHGFIDNATGRATFGESKPATKEDLEDLKSFLKRRRNQHEEQRTKRFREDFMNDLVEDPFDFGFESPFMNACFSSTPSLSPPLSPREGLSPPVDNNRQLQSKIVQCIIQDDMDRAIEIYHQEMEKNGGAPPVWADEELKFYLRAYVQRNARLNMDDVGSLFPGITL